MKIQKKKVFFFFFSEGFNEQMKESLCCTPVLILINILVFYINNVRVVLYCVIYELFIYLFVFEFYKIIINKILLE